MKIKFEKHPAFVGTLCRVKSLVRATVFVFLCTDAHSLNSKNGSQQGHCRTLHDFLQRNAENRLTERLAHAGTDLGQRILSADEVGGGFQVAVLYKLSTFYAHFPPGSLQNKDVFMTER